MVIQGEGKFNGCEAFHGNCPKMGLHRKWLPLLLISMDSEVGEGLLSESNMSALVILRDGMSIIQPDR